MSIEQDLNRIANALEKLSELAAGKMIAAPAPAAPGSTATLGGKPPKVTKATPAPAVSAPPAPAEDPITGQPIEQEATPTHTIEDVHAHLRTLMETPAKGGVEVCKKLMIKHGANPAKPVISSIPRQNYGKLMAEITEMLK